MNINIPTDDTTLDLLKRALRVSVEDYNLAANNPKAASEHAKDIMRARQALELGNYSGPGCCYDHHLAPDRDKYITTVASDKEINDLRDAVVHLVSAVEVFRSIVPSGLHLSPKYQDLIDTLDRARALLP